jgi:site-specific DNA-methyltransferase (adenine-specific)
MGINIGDGFPVLLIDPPWPYDNNQGHASARGGTPYEEISMEDLCALRPLIDQVVAKDSLLFLWATGPKMREALQLMDALGFKYTTVAFNWTKLNARGQIIIPEENMIVMNNPDKNNGFRLTPKDMVLKGGLRSGQGYYTNQNCEYVLLGKRGKTADLRVSKSVKQPVFMPDQDGWPQSEPIMTPLTVHSAKPEEVRARINELTGNVPALELFARPPGRVPGWVKLGYEIDQEDIRTMLERLIDGEYRRPPKDG